MVPAFISATIAAISSGVAWLGLSVGETGSAGTTGATGTTGTTEGLELLSSSPPPDKIIAASPPAASAALPGEELEALESELAASNVCLLKSTNPSPFWRTLTDPPKRSALAAVKSVAIPFAA